MLRKYFFPAILTVVAGGAQTDSDGSETERWHITATYERSSLSTPEFIMTKTFFNRNGMLKKKSCNNESPFHLNFSMSGVLKKC